MKKMTSQRKRIVPYVTGGSKKVRLGQPASGEGGRKSKIRKGKQREPYEKVKTCGKEKRGGGLRIGVWPAMTGSYRHSGRRGSIRTRKNDERKGKMWGPLKESGERAKKKAKGRWLICSRISRRDPKSKQNDPLWSQEGREQRGGAKQKGSVLDV